MRRLPLIILSCIALLASAWSACAQNARIRDVDISVTLFQDGSASVREIWDMTSTKGTEMYLVKENLGDIEISDLKVSDGDGAAFDNIGRWKVDASFDAKAGKCGLVKKGDGYEICWGLGYYGDHVFTVEYRMTNLVKALDDYDALHVQFVSPGISPYPEHVKVTLHGDGFSFSDENAATWAFGYNGTDVFSGGDIVYETGEAFSSDDYSLIALARFDKGIFHPSSIKGGPFSEVLETAMYGSTYEEYLKEQRSSKILGILTAVFSFGLIFLLAFVAALSVRRRNLNMFGVRKIKEIGYERELPFNGNLYESLYVLKKANCLKVDNTLASALILRMLYDGYLTVETDRKNRVEISFNENADLSKLDSGAKGLYDMMKKASGKDLILQSREFSRWSKFHTEEVNEWCDSVNSVGRAQISKDGFALSSKFSEEGQMHARRVIGFKNFLKDFTMIDERQSREVILWKDYLVFGALYGMADTVAKQLQDIDPQAFEQYVGYSPVVMNRVLYMSNNMANNITGAVIARQTAGSVGGHGGFSSFGGGGGFSGGGFGGGVR